MVPRPDMGHSRLEVATKNASESKEYALKMLSEKDQEEDPLDILDHLLVFLESEKPLNTQPTTKQKKAPLPSQYTDMGLNDILSLLGPPPPGVITEPMFTGPNFMNSPPQVALINLPPPILNDPFAFAPLLLDSLPSSMPPSFPSLSSIPPPPPPIFEFDMLPPPPPPPIMSGPPIVTTPHYNTVFSSMAQQLQQDLGVAPMELTERLHTALDAYCVSHPGKSMSWKVWASEKTIWCHYYANHPKKNLFPGVKPTS